MKKFTLLICSLAILCFPFTSSAQQIHRARPQVEEVDTDPSGYFWKHIFPNLSLTDNGDGTVTIDFVAPLAGTYLKLDCSNAPLIASLQVIGTVTSDGLILDEDELISWAISGGLPDRTFYWDSITHDFHFSDDINVYDVAPHYALIPEVGDAFETYAYGSEWYLTNVTDGNVLIKASDNNIHIGDANTATDLYAWGDTYIAGTLYGGSDLDIGSNINMLVEGRKILFPDTSVGFSTGKIYQGDAGGADGLYLYIENDELGSVEKIILKTSFVEIPKALSVSGQLSMGNDALIAVDVNSGLIASTTRFQGNGALTAQVNEISTVANNDDTVTLPAALAGLAIEIINHGAETLQIFPASGDNLGTGVDAPEELEANESVGYVAYDSTNWAKESTTEIIHAEMFDYDNGDPYTVNAANEAHMYHTNGMVAGDLADWTFDAGGAGTSFAIASIADGTPSGEQAEITTTDDHGLAIGDIVSLTAMSAGTNTGTFIVRTPVADKTFEITSTNSTNATGIMDQASVLTANTGSAGQYLMNWCASAAAAGANDVFDFAIHVGATHINSTNIRRKFGGAGDVGAMSGVSIITIADGDKVSFMITNTGDSGNITMRDFALVLVRL